MKKLLAMLLALAMVLSLAACGGAEAPAGEAETAGTEEQVEESTETAPEEESVPEEESAPEEAPVEEEPAGETAEDATETEGTSEVTVRVGSLKGPTSIGLVKLMSDTESSGSTSYAFTMETDASALMTAIVNEELDIALIPGNAASIWYNKMEGAVTCIDVNTLGVLYVIAQDGAVSSVEDLAGKTVYLPGQGTSPDYVLQYLLSQHGMSLEDVNVQYQSEGTEVIASLTADPEGVGLLPQPAVTAAVSKLEGFSVCLDLTEEWGKVCDTDLLTGVTVVRTAFLAEQPQAVAQFLADHQASTSYVAEDVAGAAQLTETYGIMEKAAVAEKAIPACNVTYVAGEDMKAMVSGYLQVLFELDPAAVGGALPGDDFYYVG